VSTSKKPRAIEKRGFGNQSILSLIRLTGSGMSRLLVHAFNYHDLHEKSIMKWDFFGKAII
jgi:hypothetical protein